MRTYMKNGKSDKSLILCIVLFVALLFCQSCSAKTRAVRQRLRGKNYDISLAKILVKKELIIGLEYNLPPFCQISLLSQEINGYDIDLIKETCSRMGVKPVFKNIDWAKKDELLRTGEIDCIWSCFSYTADRAKAYTLSMPYIKTATIITVMEKSPYKTLKDLKNKTIGMQDGSSMRSALETLSIKYGVPINVALYPTSSDALIAMELGQVDGVAHDVLVVDSIINKNRRPYRIIPEALAADECVIAFRLGDIALKNAVESVLKDMAKTDFFERASKKWFGSNISLIGR
ncbi:transporter substrate-binding domain-containing protein [Treponema pedis]|nr:transporter substrate-binding domain-containing protein [Treponema pedis]